MKYMLIIIGEEGDQQDQMSPEEMSQVLDAWQKYGEELASAGAYLAGEGLQPSPTATTVKLETSGDHVVSDGPFAETKEQLGGFYLIDVADLDEAIAWSKKIPMRPGGTVEVRPVMDFSEFGYESPQPGGG